MKLRSRLVIATAVLQLTFGLNTEGNAPLVPYPANQNALVTTRPASQPDNADFKRGLVNVLNYGATINDGSDDTAAIQAALYDAYKYHLVCYFPTGTYDVSDTLDCEQATGNRKYSYMLLGQKGNPVSNRPVIRLMQDSNGFNNIGNPKPVIKLWGRIDSQAPVSKKPGSEKPGSVFNNVVKGIDIDLTKTGNVGAAGIYFAGAQGCSVEDVRMDISNGYCGFLKSIGVNGGYYNIEIEGGQYAIYMKEHNDPVLPSRTITDTFPVFVGCRFYNQTKRVLYTRGRSPNSFIGFHIKKTNGPVFESLGNFHEQGGNLTLMDGIIELTNNGLAIDNDHQGSKGRSVYIKDVFLKNVNPIIRNTQPTNSEPGTSNGWTEVLDYGRALTGMSKKGRNLINGVQIAETPDISTSEIYLDVNETVVPTADSLINNHIWDEASFPAFDDPDTYDAVVDGGLDKTGGADVTLALNNMLAANDKVFLPKGIYKISGTITIPGNTKLFGISRTFSILRPNYSAWNPSTEEYIITTDNDANASPLLAFVWLDFTHLNPGKMISLIHWCAGQGSMIRNTFAWDKKYGSLPPMTNGFAALDKRLYKFTGNAGGRIYGLCNGWQNTALSSAHDNFRAIFVEGTSEPLNFYGFNVERQLGTYQAEFRNASNIGVFGAKTEGENPNAWKIDREDYRPMLGIVNCDNVVVATVAASVSGCKDGWVRIVESDNILCANITSQNHDGSSEHVLNLVKETFGGATRSISAQTYSTLNFQRNIATLNDFAVSSGGGGENLLANPGLESTGNNTIVPWSLVGSATAVAATYLPNSGTRSLKISGNSGLVFVEQSVPVAGGFEYDVSACMRMSGSGSGTASLEVTFMNGSSELSSYSISGDLNSSNNTWTEYYGLVQADAGATDMLVQCVKDGGGPKAWFDDIRVFELGPGAPLGPVNQEFEDLDVLAHSSRAPVPQVVGSEYVEFLSDSGEYVTYSVNFPSSGNYSIYVCYKPHSNNGKVRMKRTSGQNLGLEQDLYGSGPNVEKLFVSGAYFDAGNQGVKFKAVNKNGSSGGYEMRLDYIRVEPE